MSIHVRLPALCVLVFVGLLLSAARVEALKFEPVDSKLLPQGVKSALWVRDCGKQGFKDQNCPEAETMFFKGDGARLAGELTAKKYDEIWLVSGGGNLDEGVGVGEVFRRFQATVRVPRGYRCVSSCTVAFLGGVFRYLDEGSTYEVHAASRFLNEEVDGQSMKALLEDPDTALREWAELLLLGADMRSGRFKGARESAQILLLHFQKALHPLGMLPPGREDANRDRFRSLLRTQPPFVYPQSPQLAQDVARIKREGVPAAQDILMRIERDSVQLAIDELRAALPSLGPRAEPALKMLEAMYSSRITSTAVLSRQTMVQMGYVTELFNPNR
ncbi:MAG: hypothetical protein ABL993_16545 [Vicinamibacterales bacterium]